MKSIIWFILHSIISVFLYLLLVGHVSLSDQHFPPLLKVLHPIEGIWANGVDTNSISTIQLDRLKISDDCIIKYDERMVPHIYAPSLEEALYLQGYVVASQRLFQLEMISRSAEGKLSEIFGDRTLEIDISQNRKAMELAAKNTLESWKSFPDAIHLFQNYVDGINAYISSISYSDYPIEYKLLDFKPEPWSLYKSALVAKYMAYTLCFKQNDIANTNMRNLLGEPLYSDLFNETFDANYPVIPLEKKYAFNPIYSDTAQQDSAVDFIFKKRGFEPLKKGIGSNNWTIGKSKSSTGNTLFLNDPHLALTLPSIWFEMQIMTDSFNAYGVTIPGISGLMMGFNDHIAWGETNVGQDVNDLFVIEYADKEKSKYYLDGNILDVEFEIQEIKIKGKASYFDTIKHTYWGPIIKESKRGDKDIAMHWLATESTSTPDIMTFIEIMTCHDYKTFEKATNNFHTPAQNFLFASKAGDIALRVNGELPVRPEGDGRFVEWGNKKKHNWKKYIPRSQNPQVVNPPKDYLSSSNQRSAGSNYPYYYHGNFEYFRNQSINNALDQDTTFTLEEMMDLQGDNHSKLAADLLPILLEKTNTSNSIHKLLSDWNHEYNRNEKAPLLFNRWLEILKEFTFDEIGAYQDSMAILYPEDITLLSLIQNQCNHPIFDKLYTIPFEHCVDIINQSFTQLCKEYEYEELEPWGEARPINIPHYARIPSFSRDSITTDGWTDAINAMGTSFGPSWRMAVELSSPIKAYGIYPGGQSGNPASPYYDNGLSKWANNKYYTLYLMNLDQLKTMDSKISLNHE